MPTHKEYIEINNEEVYEYIKKYGGNPRLMGSKYFIYALDRIESLDVKDCPMEMLHSQALSQTIMRFSMYFVDNVNILPTHKLLNVCFGAWRECARLLIEKRSKILDELKNEIDEREQDLREEMEQKYPELEQKDDGPEYDTGSGWVDPQ